MLNNRPILIVLIVSILVVAVGGVVALVKGSEDDTPIAPVQPLPDDNPNELMKLEGNDILTEERETLLAPDLVAQIEQWKKGVPVEDEEGYYLTDPDGHILYETPQAERAALLEHNLKVLINHFADKGYIQQAILQIQRYYFGYADHFKGMEPMDLLEGLERCFPSDETTSEQLTKAAEQVFGQKREDGFAFAFEPLPPMAQASICFCHVKPLEHMPLSPKLQALCIYGVWAADNEEEKYLEGWLLYILAELSAKGYGEKELMIAQLLFAGSLVECDYRPDLCGALSECISATQEVAIVQLAQSAQRIFGVNIYDNVALIDYMEGRTAYQTEGEIE